MSIFRSKRTGWTITFMITVCLIAGFCPAAVYAEDGSDGIQTEACVHSWDEGECIVKASLGHTGIIRHTCMECYEASYDEEFSWSLDDPDSEKNVSYNVVYSTPVYRNSKSITVKLDNPVKGSVIKVKIGKKVYKKKVGTQRKIKIKIKQPGSYGQKIDINVYKKNTRIGKFYDYDDGEWFSCYDNVYYAKKIKKGMTRKQVANLYNWGSPDRKASASGGWTYWYYDDDSYIGFKNGKVSFWYNAAG